MRSWLLSVLILTGCATSYHWPQQSLPIRLVATDPHLILALDAAEREWADVLGPTKETLLGSGDTTVFVFTCTLAAGRIAETQTTYDSVSKIIREASVCVDMAKVPPAAMTKVLTHEIGHVLGYLGHDTDPTSIMFESLPAGPIIIRVEVVKKIKEAHGL